MTVKVSGIGDLHHDGSQSSLERVERLFATLSAGSDVLLIAGDITNRGKMSEIDSLMPILVELTCDVVAVLGNHDYHSGNADLIAAELKSAGIRVLDYESMIMEIRGETLGIVGGKGFAGGYRGTMLSAFGETEMKRFVWHGEDCARRFGLAVSEITGADIRIALSHYSPTRATLNHEPMELYPVLGSAYLGVHVDRLEPQMSIHGHVHFGSMEGTTENGWPVRNVSAPVLGWKIPAWHLGVRVISHSYDWRIG